MVADRWSELEAAACVGDLAQRVYSSRLLGRDATLVLHGGGNTSVKTTATNLFGEVEPIIHVKGSGWDLATIEARGLPALRLTPLLRLRQLAELSDPQMVNQLRGQLLDAQAPDPSVEALLHAFLPHRFIDHTHADAVLTLTNQPAGDALVRELYGRRVGIVPYVMPGFQLAKLCARVYEQDPAVIGLILLRHGVFTFGDSARESYQRMREIVGMAEAAIAARRRRCPDAPAAPGASATAGATAGEPGEPAPAWWAHAIRSELGRRGLRCSCVIDASAEAVAFAGHPHAARIALQGPLTPDHVIRTKCRPALLPAAAVAERSLPALGAALEDFAASYRGYFARGAPRAATALTMLDPWPRLLLLPGVGVAAVGATTRDARIAQDIYRQTMRVILDAEDLSSYSALPEADLFDMEYWSLEQAKLALGPKRLPLSGRTAVVSGGASGIGLAIARELLGAGANVAILDINDRGFDQLRAGLAGSCKGGNILLCQRVDVTRREQVREAVRSSVAATGGVDIVVVNAGIFTPSADIEDIRDEHWARAMDINCTGAYHLIAETLPWLKRQHGGGDILLIASKNVPAPGKQAAAYSVSKAAQTQLARVCALEAGPSGVRVNMLHPHLVLDTEIWTPEVIAARAAAYGMSVEQYRTNNLLRTEIGSRDVARSAFALVAGYFDKTTGAQICVDGGSDRTI